MLRANAYDTICHEHVEYYAFAQIKWLADKVGLTILDVERNDVNGGSFAVKLGGGGGVAPEGRAGGMGRLNEERRSGFDPPRPLTEVLDRVIVPKRGAAARLEAVRAP